MDKYPNSYEKGEMERAAETHVSAKLGPKTSTVETKLGSNSRAVNCQPLVKPLSLIGHKPLLKFESF
jgi:hypothetical protein